MKRLWAGLAVASLSVLARGQDVSSDDPAFWTTDKAHAAATQVKPAFVTNAAIAPDLELERQKEPAAPDLKVDADVELGTSTEITPIADGQFRVHMKQNAYPNWYIFHVTNVPAGGKTVRFDVDNSNVNKLITANPVFCTATDLADLATYEPEAKEIKTTAAAHNGAQLPTDDAMPWKFIPDVWRTSPTDISFVHKFDKDTYVALRVPYGPAYQANFVKTLEGKPGTTVSHIGGDAGPAVIEVGSADADKKMKNPTVVIYAREDGCQQDSSWFIEGAARFLTGDAPEAAAAREKCTFVLIPIFDLDAANTCQWSQPSQNFMTGQASGLTQLYQDYFQHWTADGHKIAAVVDLFTPESSEYAQLNGVHVENANDDVAFNDKLAAFFEKSPPFRFVRPAGGSSTFEERLVGYLHQQAGALQLMYFVNCQDKTRHLSLTEVRRLGSAFCLQAADFFSEQEAKGATP